MFKLSFLFLYCDGEFHSSPQKTDYSWHEIAVRESLTWFSCLQLQEVSRFLATDAIPG